MVGVDAVGNVVHCATGGSGCGGGDDDDDCATGGGGCWVVGRGVRFDDADRHRTAKLLHCESEVSEEEVVDEDDDVVATRIGKMNGNKLDVIQ